MNNIEQRKEQVYQLLIDERMTVTKLSKIIDVHPKTLVNTLRILAKHNNLISERVYDNVASRFVVEYTSNTRNPYTAIIKKTKRDIKKEERLAKEAEKKRLADLVPKNCNSHIHRLLDNPLSPAPKSKKSAAYKGIGSSFSMYDYY